MNFSEDSHGGDRNFSRWKTCGRDGDNKWKSGGRDVDAWKMAWKMAWKYWALPQTRFTIVIRQVSASTHARAPVVCWQCQSKMRSADSETQSRGNCNVIRHYSTNNAACICQYYSGCVVIKLSLSSQQTRKCWSQLRHLSTNVSNSSLHLLSVFSAKLHHSQQILSTRVELYHDVALKTVTHEPTRSSVIIPQLLKSFLDLTWNYINTHRLKTSTGPASWTLSQMKIWY